MKTSYATIAALLVPATKALASGNAGEEGMSLFAAIFLAFAVLIVMFQLVPGVMLFVGMIKGIFSSEKKAAESTSKS
ncbi:hypothetical protein [Pelotalea chapellei]|uniref:Uncharacterized protein n=1 Tax=Pelotalea chapellei TaxID=44671 RepID=A0ABS5U6V9_9BACT|nr:hypothetical protein [Pelotalea chapellei]MBT1071399.1 hypothetical protein [Pelotalea chapellei]